MKIKTQILPLLLLASFSSISHSDEVQAVVNCDFNLLEGAIGDKALGEQLITYVPEDGTHTCDFYAMGWNNFLYLAAKDDSGSPRMMSYAPWYYVDLSYQGKQSVTEYPTTKAPLNPSEIGKFMGQAGDGWDLHTKNGQKVMFDVRMNKVMYDYIIEEQAYKPSVLETNTGYENGASVASSDVGNLKLSYPPNSVPFLESQKQTAKLEEGSIEYKTSWVDFESAKNCPSEMYCEGQFGLAGMHIAQKTLNHGEWIWWSFEYVGNTPDCEATTPVGESPIAYYDSSSPINSRDDWLFFDTEKWKNDQPEADNNCAVPTSEQAFSDGTELSQICSGVKPTPSSKKFCNQNPMIDFLKPTTDSSNYTSVNVCRTESLPAAETVRSKGLCVTSGTQGLQTAQMTCLNDDIVKGNFSINAQVDSVWTKNYVQIGSIWTLPGVTPLPAYSRGNVIITDAMKKGFPNLANTTLETWMQKGANSPYCKADSSGKNTASTWQEKDCLSCHKALFEASTSAPGQAPEKPNEGRVDFSHLLERVINNNRSVTVEKAAE